MHAGTSADWIISIEHTKPRLDAQNMQWIWLAMPHEVTGSICVFPSHRLSALRCTLSYWYLALTLTLIPSAWDVLSFSPSSTALFSGSLFEKVLPLCQLSLWYAFKTFLTCSSLPSLGVAYVCVWGGGVLSASFSYCAVSTKSRNNARVMTNGNTAPHLMS